MSDSIGIRSEFPARARLLDSERGKEAVGADPPWKIASEARLDSRALHHALARTSQSKTITGASGNLVQGAAAAAGEK